MYAAEARRVTLSRGHVQADWDAQASPRTEAARNHAIIRGSYLTGCLIPSGARLNRMELNGALLNREQQRRLLDGQQLARVLAGRPEPKTQTQSQIRPRAGAVQETVIRVLAVAEGPLQACEIHAAAEKLADTPLSWNTVKDCLHKNARRPDSPIERVSHGRYRHRSATPAQPY